MVKQVIIIKADGTIEITEPVKKPSLEKMQRIVGGYIEAVRGIRYKEHTVTMVVNEEGLIHNLPFNTEASAIAGRTIVGDVFILIGWRL